MINVPCCRASTVAACPAVRAILLRWIGTVVAVVALAGCVAYEPAPAYTYGGYGYGYGYGYAPGYYYYPAPTYGPSVNLGFAFGDRDRWRGGGWRGGGWRHDR